MTTTESRPTAPDLTVTQNGELLLPKVAFIQTAPAADIEVINPGDPYINWIGDLTGLPTGQIDLYNVADGDILPDTWDEHDGIIGGGSGANTRDYQKWIPRTRQAFAALGQDGGPHFNGICFSHELYSEAKGGTIESVPRPGNPDLQGYNFGIEELTLTDEGKDHPLLKGMGDKLLIMKSHGRRVTQDSVPGAVVLATGKGEGPNELLSVGNALITQGHWELTTGRALNLAGRRLPKLIDKGIITSRDADRIVGEIKDLGPTAEQHGRQVGRRWVQQAVMPRFQARVAA